MDDVTKLIDEIRDEHTVVGGLQWARGEGCYLCEQEWPCAAIRAAEMLEQLSAANSLLARTLDKLPRPERVALACRVLAL